MSTELIIENSLDLKQDRTNSSSRLPGFYELPLRQRLDVVQGFASLTPEEREVIAHCGPLSPALVDVFIENGIGTFTLPLGIATNFLINGKDLIVPMAVEETSVLAAASHGAKLARAGGGFHCESSAPVMTGQVQVFCSDPRSLETFLQAEPQRLLQWANEGQDRLMSRGGGAKSFRHEYIAPIQSVIIYIDVDTRDAMGANIVNTMCERIATHLEQELNVVTGLRILTNLSDKRLASARCVIPSSAFDSNEYRGIEVVKRIEQAYLFAFHDPYRAATHNKGVMNGIDPVAIATGNDWRAIEAGAHAYCARSGHYRPMTSWSANADGDLEGHIEIPLAVGTVGGVTKLHPTAQAALRILGSPSSQELAEIMVAVGLAQNLSALRALASEGIQQGHMGLHQKNLSLLRQGASKQP